MTPTELGTHWFLVLMQLGDVGDPTLFRPLVLLSKDARILAELFFFFFFNFDKFLQDFDHFKPTKGNRDEGTGPRLRPRRPCTAAGAICWRLAELMPFAVTKLC